MFLGDLAKQLWIIEYTPCKNTKYLVDLPTIMVIFVYGKIRSLYLSVCSS